MTDTSLAVRVLTVAIQGEPGSFSEAAARRLAPTARIACYGTFEEVAAAVARGAAERGLLPAENSLVGRVADLKGLLEEHALAHVDEVTLPIRQCLIAALPVHLADVREVRSHPVALSQCRRFLETHPWMRAVAVADTAGAVREIVAEGRPELAAIAGEAAAEVHGGRILAWDIADRADNVTRFVLFARKRRKVR